MRMGFSHAYYGAIRHAITVAIFAWMLKPVYQRWDQVGERLFETGVDHGVLYIPDANGNYDVAVAEPGSGMKGVTSALERRSDKRRSVEIGARPGAG